MYPTKSSKIQLHWNLATFIWLRCTTATSSQFQWLNIDCAPAVWRIVNLLSIFSTKKITLRINGKLKSQILKIKESISRLLIQITNSISRAICFFFFCNILGRPVFHILNGVLLEEDIFFIFWLVLILWFVWIWFSVVFELLVFSYYKLSVYCGIVNCIVVRQILSPPYKLWPAPDKSRNFQNYHSFQN